MKIKPVDMTAGVLVDPETKREYPFSDNQPIEVPDETGASAIKSGLWTEAATKEQ